jgi:hypothetical protein
MPRRLGVRGLQQFAHAIPYGMLLMHIGQKTPLAPLTDHTPSQRARTQGIRAR